MIPATLQALDTTLSLRRATGRGPLMLASVRTVDEARVAAAAGADLIDCKDPERGALGALPAAIIGEIVETVSGRVPVSATIGDEGAALACVAEAVAATAKSGVDIVKVGIAADPDAPLVIAAAGVAMPRGAGQGLVGVLFADLGFSLALVDACRAAGFSGVMLDTSAKKGGNLFSHTDAGGLRAFVGHARAVGLWCGLAGGLSVRDVAAASALEPDILGFRGGLCASGDRRLGLDAEAVQAVRRALDEQGSGPRRARAEPAETRA